MTAVILRMLVRSLGLDTLAPLLVQSPLLATYVTNLEQKVSILFDAADLLTDDSGEVTPTACRPAARPPRRRPLY